MVFPEDSAAIVVLTNQDAAPAASAIANQIAQILFTTEDKLADSRTAQARAIFDGPPARDDRPLTLHVERERVLQRPGAPGFPIDLGPLGTPTSFVQTRSRARRDDLPVVSSDVPEPCSAGCGRTRCPTGSWSSIK